VEEQRKQADRLRDELAPLVAAYQKALRANDYLAAEEQVKAILAKSNGNPVINGEYEGALLALQAKTRLFRLLVDGVNEGKLAKTKVTVQGIEGKPKTADSTAVNLSTGGTGTVPINWSSVPARVMYDMYIALNLGREDQRLLALFCYDNNLSKQGDKALYVWGGGKNMDTARKTEIDQLLAKRRKLANVPDGGFVYHKESWVTQGEMNDLLALEGLKDPLKKLAEAKSEKVMGKYFDDVYDLYVKDGVSPVVKERIKDEIIAALEANKEAQIKAVMKKSRPTAKLGDLKKKLNEYRAEAMRIIFDKSIYPDEDHGRVGQPTVDKAVDKVKALWENPKAVVVKNDKNITKAIEQVVAVNNKYLSKMGITPQEGEFDRIQDLVINADEDVLDVRTYATTQDERDIMTHNKEVDRFNAAFKGVPADIKEQVRITNDYREMMGLRKVKINKQLCDAAQGHSNDQAAEGRIWHNGANGSPSSRCKAKGYNAPVGENCALGYGSPEGAHNGWYNSSGHHRNILNGRWNELGVGHSGNVWTQNFGMGSSKKRR
jgi:hypothetical protein